MTQNFADWLVYDIFGLSSSTALGTAVNFFFYDSIKIIILLFFISILMGIINAYFPIEEPSPPSVPALPFHFSSDLSRAAYHWE